MSRISSWTTEDSCITLINSEKHDFFDLTVGMEQDQGVTVQPL